MALNNKLKYFDKINILKSYIKQSNNKSHCIGYM